MVEGGGGGTGAGGGRRDDDNQDVGGPVRKRVRINQPSPTARHVHIDYLTALLCIDQVGGSDNMNSVVRCAALAAFLADPTDKALADGEAGGFYNRAAAAAHLAAGANILDADVVMQQVISCQVALRHMLQGHLDRAAKEFHDSGTTDGVIESQLNSNVCIPFASGSSP